MSFSFPNKERKEKERKKKERKKRKKSKERKIKYPVDGEGSGDDEKANCLEPKHTRRLGELDVIANQNAGTHCMQCNAMQCSRQKTG